MRINRDILIDRITDVKPYYGEALEWLYGLTGFELENLLTSLEEERSDGRMDNSNMYVDKPHNIRPKPNYTRGTTSIVGGKL